MHSCRPPPQSNKPTHRPLSSSSPSSTDADEDSRNARPDVSFYSFGTIKTATALGGAVVVVHPTAALSEREEDKATQAPIPPPTPLPLPLLMLMRGRPLYHRLAHLERSLPATQTSGELLFKLARTSALHVLSTPGACGLLSSLLGPQVYDEQVTRWTRGFPARDEAGLVRMLRRRPHPVVVELMRRRVRGVETDPRYLLARWVDFRISIYIHHHLL